MTTLAPVFSYAPANAGKQALESPQTPGSNIVAHPFDLNVLLNQLLPNLDELHYHSTIQIPYEVFQVITFEDLRQLVAQSMTERGYSSQQVQKATSILEQSYLSCLDHSPVRVCVATLEKELPEFLEITTSEYFFQQLEAAREAISCANILNLPADKVDGHIAQLSTLLAYLMRVQGLLWYLQQPNLQQHIMDYALAGQKDVMRVFFPNVISSFPDFCSQLKVMATMNLDSSIQELQKRIHLVKTMQVVSVDEEAPELELYEEHVQAFDNAFIRIIRDSLLLSLTQIKENGSGHPELLTVLNQALSRHPTCTKRDILQVEDSSDVMTDRFVNEVWEVFASVSMEDGILLVLECLSPADLNALAGALELIEDNREQAIKCGWHEGQRNYSTCLSISKR